MPDKNNTIADLEARLKALELENALLSQSSIPIQKKMWLGVPVENIQANVSVEASARFKPRKHERATVEVNAELGKLAKEQNFEANVKELIAKLEAANKRLRSP